MSEERREERCAERGQRALLERFFREEGVWYPEYYAFYVVAVVCLGITLLIYLFPFQIWEGEYQIFITLIFLELMGLEMYLRRYSQFRENGKMKSVRELLQYLPVSGRQLILYRLGKMMRLCLWMTAATAVCQTVSALAFLHTFSPGNLLMPLILCLVLPMLLLGGCEAAGYVWGKIWFRMRGR